MATSLAPLPISWQMGDDYNQNLANKQQLELIT